MRREADTAIRATEGVEVVGGRARFLQDGPGGVRRVAVGERVLEAEKVVLDVGARPARPPVAGLEDVAWMTEVELLELFELPEHLVVMGAGYIGLEFAQMFRRFGSQVTVVAGGGVTAQEDDDVVEAVTAVLTGEGVRIVAGRAVAVAPDGAGVAVQVDGPDGPVSVAGSHLLVATGRVPDTDDLGLELVGVQRDRRGTIRIDEDFATTASGIWALGDANGHGAFTHTAYQDFEIFVQHLHGRARSVAGRLTTYAMFLDPPLARVGMSEREALAAGRRVLKAQIPMASVSRARLESETEGLMKVLVDADTDRFLGAVVLGLQGDDVVQVVSALMHADAPYTVLRDMLPVHPTVAEFFPTLLGRLEPVQAPAPAPALAA
jgi:pyruvate/2-oxoglutarate dehydrogenase complex dihydrolipoamide dehydrogenase (E3) component